MGDWKRETVNVKKNGELFFVHLTSIAVKDKTGVPIGMITACEDITKHRRLEDEHKKRLKELEEFYDLAVGMEVRMRQLKEENEELKEALKNMTSR